ncbi:MAG: hypothetical protein KDB23_26775, partial [Planctomycetales bacterium]|nr:hypothetical protein [Planctomycetales bacterium]
VKPYAMLGAGTLSATLWKVRVNGDQWEYFFNLFRSSETDGSVTQRFTAEDLIQLVKLAQVLASVLDEDGCLDHALRLRMRRLHVWLDMMFHSE